jgi:hypothetical protein
VGDGSSDGISEVMLDAQWANVNVSFGASLEKCSAAAHRSAVNRSGQAQPNLTRSDLTRSGLTRPNMTRPNLTAVVGQDGQSDKLSPPRDQPNLPSVLPR